MSSELIADYRCKTGEGPLWHPQEKRLYWCDIPAGRMFRYDPATGRHEQCYSGEQVGGFTVQSDGALLLFMARGAVKIWREGGLETVVEEIQDERETRFNREDAKTHEKDRRPKTGDPPSPVPGLPSSFAVLASWREAICLEAQVHDRNAVGRSNWNQPLDISRECHIL